MRGRPVSPITLSSEDRFELERRVRASTSSQRDVERARIILARAEGLSQHETAARLNCSAKRVAKWTQRFRRLGKAGLVDEVGRGRKSSLDPAKVHVVLTEVTRPPKGRARWSTRSMAKHAGMSESSVRKLWQANDLKPHLQKVFKVSNDPRFEEKFWDVIGLYLNPPEKALILCCDEKSQCQALERTQRALPLKPGKRATCTHDYVRHGTVTLFAALDYLGGKIFSRTEEKHTHQEWLRFLKQIDRSTPAEMTLHLIVDNYATHKKEEVLAWIEQRNRRQEKTIGAPRIVLHFTPTSSSWLNLVERFFGDLSQQAIARESFRSVGELVERIETYLAEHNLQPKRYVWRADGAEILRKIREARAVLATP